MRRLLARCAQCRYQSTYKAHRPYKYASDQQIDPIPKRRSWRENPGLPMAIAFLLLTTSYLNLLGAQHVHTDYSISSKARINTLKKVIERIHAGEEVDVTRELGTGVRHDEVGWEDLLKDIEQQEIEWQKSAKEALKRREATADDSQPRSDAVKSNRVAKTDYYI